MKAGDRLDRILNFLNISNAEISRVGKVDPAFVSRFRTNKRIPGSPSHQLRNMCDGIATLAEKKNKNKELISGFNLSKTTALSEAICAYLLEKSSLNIQDLPSLTTESEKAAQRLDIVLKLLGIANIEIARAIKVDASLISRYRNGGRPLPRRNSTQSYMLVEYILGVAKERQLEKELEELIGLELPEGFSGHQKFGEWLFQGHDERPIDAFLKKLGSVSKERPTDINKAIAAQKGMPPGTKDTYFGLSGLREAVLRLLSAVAMHRTQEEILLYSDQSMEWMQDEEFVLRWTFLMQEVLKKHKLKIIHNTSRKLDEMLSGIDKWLELYMSGNIQGFFLPGTASKQFSNMMIVVPGLAAIDGHHVYGTESNGIYRYIERDTRHYERQINALFNSSRPLVQVVKERDIKENILQIDTRYKRRGALKRLSSGPLADTMPKELLSQILKDRGLKEDKIEDIITASEKLKSRRNIFQKDSKVVDFIALPSAKEVLQGRANLNLVGTFPDLLIAYKPQEYIKHIKALIDMLEDPMYDIVVLSRNPLDNIQMEIGEKNTAMVLKTDRPTAVFRFEHDLMISAFGKYIERLGRNLGIFGKQKVISLLQGETKALEASAN